MMYSPQDIIARVGQLQGERSTFLSHWEELRRYLVPNQEVQNKRQPGAKNHGEIYENSGIISLSLLAGFIHGLLTNPNQVWFELSTGDDDLDSEAEVREWLQDSDKRIIAMLNNTNFQTQIHPYYLNLCGFGTAVLSMEEDEDYIMRFGARRLKECCVVENNKGQIDDIYRTFEMNSKQLVQEFGEENVIEKVLKYFKEGKPDKFEVTQCVYPNLEKQGPFPYLSKYILHEEAKVLREKGYWEFPFAVSRWEVEAGEVYGRSPGMAALPEIKTVNKISEQMLIAGAKNCDPPLQMPDDGFVMPARTKPGGQSYYRAGSTDRIEPIYKDIKLDWSIELLNQRNERIRQTFYSDQLQMRQGGPQKTAAEVYQIAEEQMRLLGPMLGRQNHESGEPIISRAFGVMLRAGKLKPVPRILAQSDQMQSRRGKLDVRYTSMIAIAQRAAEGQNITRTLGAVAPLGEIDPSVWDIFNLDQTAKTLAKINGYPQKAMNSDDAVEERRQARQEAQQAQLDEQQQMMQAEQQVKQAQTAKALQAV